MKRLLYKISSFVVVLHKYILFGYIMDKLHGKKQVASKKKKQTSENKIRTVKKMRGGQKI